MQENSFFARLASLYLGHPKFQDVFMEDDPLSNHCMKFNDKSTKENPMLGEGQMRY
jgi:hypothetical protein